MICNGTECGGTIRDVTGMISYPDVDNKVQYDNKIDCCWQIFANETDRIEIYFLRLDLQRSDGCISDYLEVSNFSPCFKFCLVDYSIPYILDKDF